MGDASFAVLIILLVVAFLVLTICHYCDLIPWLRAWVKSNREEKIGLTLLRGHYHPNGYLVHSDSTDIHLGTSGSFKRFDSVDRDFRITATTNSPYCDVTGTGISDWNNLYHSHNNAGQHGTGQYQQQQQQQQAAMRRSPEMAGGRGDCEIPPQPLRPAPTMPPQSPVPRSGGGRERERGAMRGRSRDASRDGSADDMDEPRPRIEPIYNPLTTSSIETSSTDTGTTTTSIRPIPRPVSSVNMVALQQYAAISTGYPFINPLPPPPTPTVPTSQQSISTTASTTDEPDPLTNISLKRAVSCESVCSDTSVALENLEASNITGYLCVALEYDSDNQEMVANVLEAKDLQPPATISNIDTPMDTYIRIFLLPDRTTNIQTKVIRCSNSPSYKERVLFNLHPRDQTQRSLSFHVYSVDQLSHSLIGEGELRLGDISLRQPVTTWITLTDTGQRGTEFGEVMFSLSYLPTAERLTVVVVKARNLNYSNDKETGDAFVKVYLLQNGKKMHKKKTSTKKSERCPIFNEAMMFSVPAHNLQTIQLRLTVAEASNIENVKAYAVGHVIVGAQATGRSLNHWNQMLAALRKPVAMWHSLRK